MTARWIFLSAILAVLVATSPFAHAAPTGMRRIAVLVGANDPPPGRQALRFAHDDANELAEVLRRVGAFAAGDVHVLLDPHPAEILAAIDAAAHAAGGADVMFVFYYSGHSDGQSLFPHGEVVSLADVRSRIEHLKARIRVGILDTCRGGSWTQSKGLTVGPPLDMADLLNVETEGTALVSSSSGFEDAHEASDVHGSRRRRSTRASRSGVDGGHPDRWLLDTISGTASPIDSRGTCPGRRCRTGSAIREGSRSCLTWGWPRTAGTA